MKYLLLDMDGTICEFFDPLGKIHMSEFPVGFFLNKRPLTTIINAVKELYSNYRIIIFSSSPNEVADEEKIQWLKNNGLDYEHIFVRFRTADKGQVLMNFIKVNNLNPKDITLVDDDLRVLNSCEKLGVNCIHPSHLLAEYEVKHNIK